MQTFDIQPFAGVHPITFGMSRQRVQEVMGFPDNTQPVWDGSGSVEFWNSSCINVGYNNERVVNHLGFRPGDFELRLLGSVLWSPTQQPDPNPNLLRYEPAPLETLGILVFPRLGVTTTGYHDGDENQRALVVFPRGAWDKYLKEATKPNLDKY